MHACQASRCRSPHCPRCAVLRCAEDHISLGAELADDSLIIGQHQISHPSATGVLGVALGACIAWCCHAGVVRPRASPAFPQSPCNLSQAALGCPPSRLAAACGQVVRRSPGCAHQAHLLHVGRQAQYLVHVCSAAGGNALCVCCASHASPVAMHPHLACPACLDLLKSLRMLTSTPLHSNRG